MAHTTDTSSSSWKKIDEELNNMLLSDSFRGSQLPHHVRCVAFYLLQRGFKPAFLARTFGASRITMNSLASAFATGRYKHVTNEFDNLGMDAFGEKYFTEYYRLRLQAGQLAFLHPPKPSK